MKKYLLISLIAALLLAPSTAAANEQNETTQQLIQEVPFTDRDFIYPEFRESVLWLYQNKYSKGYSDGTFKPLRPIRRVEFLKMLLLARYGEETIYNSVEGIALFWCFNDLREDAWYLKYVCFAKQQGILDGYPDGSFRPGNNVTHAEALKITLRTLGFEPLSLEGEWYAGYQAKAELLGVYGNLVFKPDEAITRQESAELIHRIAEASL